MSSVVDCCLEVVSLVGVISSLVVATLSCCVFAIVHFAAARVVHVAKVLLSDV